MVALAGFMKLLTPYFLDAFKGPVHQPPPQPPAEVPGRARHRGKLRAPATRSWASRVIRVDAGSGHGPILLQKSFARDGHGDPRRGRGAHPRPGARVVSAVVISRLLDEIDGMAGPHAAARATGRRRDEGARARLRRPRARPGLEACGEQHACSACSSARGTRAPRRRAPTSPR